MLRGMSSIMKNSIICDAVFEWIWSDKRTLFIFGKIRKPNKNEKVENQTKMKRYRKCPEIRDCPIFGSATQNTFNIPSKHTI